MKKIMKLRKIDLKCKHLKKLISRKNNSNKISCRRKYLYQQIESPCNTNEYLINNNSSPFFIDDEEEDSPIIKPSSILVFEDDANSELDLFSIKDLNSTNEESMILNENTDQTKAIMDKCLDEGKK